MRGGPHLTAPLEQVLVLARPSQLDAHLGQLAAHLAERQRRPLGLGDRVIGVVNDKTETVVFVLWGASARRKRALIDTDRHVIIESAHPSPLSASNGFFGSRPFSAANAALQRAGREPIDWRLP